MEKEIDALFVHMSELMARLPEIERQNERFLKAVAANEILACVREVDAAQRTLDGTSLRVREAMENGSMSGQFLFGNSESYNIGVLTDRKHRLMAALKKYGYADAEAAKADVMPDDAFAELQDMLTRFRVDYETTLAKCQKSQNEG